MNQADAKLIAKTIKALQFQIDNIQKNMNNIIKVIDVQNNCIVDIQNEYLNGKSKKKSKKKEEGEDLIDKLKYIG